LLTTVFTGVCGFVAALFAISAQDFGPEGLEDCCGGEF